MTKRADGHWGLDVAGAGVIKLNTAGKYLNNDIDIVTKAGKAVMNGPVNGTGATASANASGNTITLTKSLSLTPTVTQGWVDAGTASEVTVSLTAEMENQSDLIKGTTTVEGAVAKRGEASWHTGYIVEGKLPAAQFANTGSNGATYVDISETTDAPILASNGFLYINQGYVDNLKISLAKLVPDGMVIPQGHILSDGILSGYSAYDNDGKLIAGTIPTNSGSNITFDGGQVTVGSGYYASATTVDMPAGSATLSGTASGAIATLTPVLTDGKYHFADKVTLEGTTTADLHAGYIDSIADGEITGEATISATLDQIKLNAGLSGRTSAVTPVIHKETLTGNVVDASTGEATTTAPTSGVYVAVKSDANTAAIKATPAVAAAGYGKDGEFIMGDEAQATVGANESATTYVKIAESTVSYTATEDTVSYTDGWVKAGSTTISAATIKNVDTALEASDMDWSATGEGTGDDAGYYVVKGSTSLVSKEVAPVVQTAGYVSDAKGTKTAATFSMPARTYEYKIEIFDGSYEVHAAPAA